MKSTRDGSRGLIIWRLSFRQPGSRRQRRPRRGATMLHGHHPAPHPLDDERFWLLHRQLTALLAELNGESDAFWRRPEPPWRPSPSPCWPSTASAACRLAAPSAHTASARSRSSACRRCPQPPRTRHRRRCSRRSSPGIARELHYRRRPDQPPPHRPPSASTSAGFQLIDNYAPTSTSTTASAWLPRPRPPELSQIRPRFSPFPMARVGSASDPCDASGSVALPQSHAGSARPDSGRVVGGANADGSGLDQLYQRRPEAGPRGTGECQSALARRRRQRSGAR